MSEDPIAVQKSNNGDKMRNRNKSNKHHKYKPKKKKGDLSRDEIAKLKGKISELENLNPIEIDSFAKLPICAKTLKGLKENGYTEPTRVQRQTLVHSLKGVDVVAAAKTGSGKTLAFVIPMLEELNRNMWTNEDGLGALIITPTRELAYQIYEVVNKVGKYHYFTTALVIGGKDWKYEKYKVSSCNILVCTPGRLLHHMTVYTEFNCGNVQVIVLDEADMCLSMGFAETMNSILDEIPKKRKTYLFSATQTKQVKDLIRAGCVDPVICSVHENSKTSTPTSLKESYMVCDTHDKLNFLYSFLKHHKKHKILVFFATCKQVTYVNSVFRQLRPGLSVLRIHGGIHQLRRMAVYDEFCRKKHAVLFATDVAARGLDIPEVDWVIHADCPENVNTYIHRAGRTARYSKTGESLLVLTPSQESEMILKLKAKNVPIEKIFVDARKLQSLKIPLEIAVSKHVHIKEQAQRAFKSYIKNVALMSDKSIFDPTTIDLDSYARSLGLIVTPRVRFLEKKLKQKNLQKNIDGTFDQCSSLSTFNFGKDDDNDNDDFLISKKGSKKAIEIETAIVESSTTDNFKDKKILTKAAVVKKLLKKNLQLNTKRTFDDEGDVVLDPTKQQVSEVALEEQSNIKNEDQRGINIDHLQKIMKEEDKIDKKIHSGKMKEKHRIERAQRKEENRAKHQKVDAEEDENSDEQENLEDGEEKENPEDGDEKENLEDEEEYDSESDYDPELQEIIDDLPDPDKVYGKSKEKEDGSNEESVESDEEVSTQKISGKRKAKLKSREIKRARLAQTNNLETLPMEEQEKLALYLLQNR